MKKIVSLVLFLILCFAFGSTDVYAFDETELPSGSIEPMWFVFEPRIGQTNDPYSQNPPNYNKLEPHYYGGGVTGPGLNDEKFKIVASTGGVDTRLKPNNSGLTLAEINSGSNPVKVFSSTVSITVTRLPNTPYTNDTPKIYFADDSQTFGNIPFVRDHISSAYHGNKVGNGKVFYRYGDSEAAINSANWSFKSVNLDIHSSLNLVTPTFVNGRLYQIIIIYEIKEEKPNWWEFRNSDYYYQIIGQYYFGYSN